MTPPAAYDYLIACNGQTFDKAKYPQLAKLFSNGVLPNLNDNRFLEGSTSAGQSKNAGLPQHTHSGTTDWNGDHYHGTYGSEQNGPWGNFDNASTSGGHDPDNNNHHWNSSTAGNHCHNFTTGNASNDIYGKSDTVQPKSYTVTYYVCYA